MSATIQRQPNLWVDNRILEGYIYSRTSSFLDILTAIKHRRALRTSNRNGGWVLQPTGRHPGQNASRPHFWHAKVTQETCTNEGHLHERNLRKSFRHRLNSQWFGSEFRYCCVQDY